MDLESGYPRDDIQLYQNEPLQIPNKQSDHSESSLLNNPDTRLQFVRKVFSILLAQISFTALMSYISMNDYSFAEFQSSSITMIILSCVGLISIMIAFVCNKRLARTVPTNYILLAIFTSCESYLISLACSSLSWDSQGRSIADGKALVYMAAILTLGVTLALVAYAFTTKSDITMRGSMLFIGISVSSLSFMLLLFFNFYLFEIAMCSVSAVLYSIYIIYDCQLIMGGKHLQLTVDDYIIGAMMLYVDIARLFLRILSLLAKAKSRK